MEAITIFFIQSIIGGIIGNRADSVTISAYERIAKRFKKSGISQNHDIERAIRKSYLLATIAAFTQILKNESDNLKWRIYFSPSAKIKWLRKAIETFKSELRQLDNPDYSIPIREEEIDVGALISNKSKATFKETLQSELLRELKQRFSDVPEGVLKNLFGNNIAAIEADYNGWYELLCAFFVEELKENVQLRSIFDAQILSDIKQVGLSIPIEQVLQCLSEIGEKTIESIKEVHQVVAESALATGRIESQLTEIHALFKEHLNINSQHKRNIVANKYIGYEITRQQINRINQLTKESIVGRVDFLEKIDKYIISHNSGTILVTAPAGYGKSAVLSSWIKQKEAQGFYIVRHFFSSENQSTLQAYAHLVKQMLGYYRIEGEIIPDRADLLRDMFIGLSEKEDTKDDHPLIIVIDGLDEADIPIKAFSEAAVQKNVFIICSLRTNETHEIPIHFNTWKENSYILSLQALKQEDLKDWIQQIPKAFSGININLLAKLCFEKTNGYPLYLKFLFDDLRNTTFTVEQIKKRVSDAPLGFEAYVKEQFTLLARQGEIQSRKDLQALFAMLSVSVGPLEDQDLVNMLGLSSWDLNALPWSIERWLNIQSNSNHTTFIFAHPLLASVFANLLGREAKEAELKLLSYCALWKQHKSPFALQYYVNQLLISGFYQNAIQLLVGNKEWILAKRLKFRSDKPILDDIEKLLSYIQEREINLSLNEIVQIFSLRELINQRALRYSDINVKRLVYQDKIEEAMEIATIQFDSQKRIGLLIAIFVAMRKKALETKEVESALFALCSNFEKSGISLAEIAFVLRMTINDYPDFTENFAHHFLDIDFEKIPAQDQITLFGLLFPYLSRIYQQKVIDQISSILNDFKEEFEFKTESLARTGHPQIEQYLKEKIQSGKANAANISIISSCLPIQQKKLALEVFNWLWTQLDKAEKKEKETGTASPKITAANYLYLEPAFNLLKMGEAEPALRLLILLEENSIDISENRSVHFILEKIAESGFCEEAFSKLPLLRESLEGISLKVKISCLSIKQNITGEWEQLIVEALQELNKRDSSEQLDNAILNVFSTIKKELNNKTQIELNLQLISLAKKINEDGNRLSASVSLIQMGLTEAASQLLISIEEIDKIHNSQIGELALELYQVGLNDLAEKYYAAYQSKRQKYDLYEQRGLTVLAGLARQLSKMGQITLADELLNHAFELAIQPSDPNYLRDEEWDYLATVLLERGRVKEAEEIQAGISTRTESYQFMDPQVFIKFLEDSPLESIPMPNSTIAKKFFESYVKIKHINGGSVEKEVFERLNSKYQDHLLNSNSSGHLEYLFLLIKEGLIYQMQLDDYTTGLIVQGEFVKSVSDAISSVITACVLNGYFACAWEIIQTEQHYSPNAEYRERIYSILNQIKDCKESIKIRQFLLKNNLKGEEKAFSNKLISSFLSAEKSAQKYSTLLLLPKLHENLGEEFCSKAQTIQLLYNASNVLSWEEPFFVKINQIFANALIDDSKALSNDFIPEPIENTPAIIESLVLYLRGIRFYRQGDFDAAEDLFNEIIRQSNCCTSQAYYAKGVIKLLKQDLSQALSDFDAVTHEGLKGYADGMAIRTSLLQKDTTGVNERIKIYQETEPIGYWGWKTVADAFDKNWDMIVTGANHFIEAFTKDNDRLNYQVGMSYAYLTLAHFKLNETALFEKSLERLIFSFENELFKPRRFHLGFLIHLLYPSYFGSKSYSFDELLDKAHLGRLDHAGLRAFLNCLVDLEVFLSNQISPDDSLKIKGELLSILHPPKNKDIESEILNPGDKKISNDLIDIELGLNEVVILLQGTNFFGVLIFTYVKLSLNGFRKMRDAIIERRDCTPSDFGEVVASGYGLPNYEIKIEAMIKYKMVNVPRHAVTIWD